MTQNFDKIMDFVFKWEGWKSSDPDDVGGRTVWGICERDYPVDVPKMWIMSKQGAQNYAKTIFRRDYWDKVNGDELENKTDAVIMDTAVNMGRHFALQLKPLSTEDAVMKRLQRYTEIAAQGNNIKFLRGWFRRVLDLYNFIKTL